MRTRSMLFAGAAGILTLGIALPASASGGDTTTTTATVTVTGGALGISVPGDAGNLGTRANTADGGRITGELGVVRVADARGVPAGSSWVASVISTPFTAPSGATIPASAVSYDAGLFVDVIKLGAATFDRPRQSNLTDTVAAVTATAITGNTSVTWNPTITVNIPPGGMAAGVYSATITHSVL
jgi:hypothetical protein